MGIILFAIYAYTEMKSCAFASKFHNLQLRFHFTCALTLIFAYIWISYEPVYVSFVQKSDSFCECVGVLRISITNLTYFYSFLKEIYANAQNSLIEFNTKSNSARPSPRFTENCP